MQCANNLRQLGLGMHNAHSSLGGFPMNETKPVARYWGAQIIPYLEQVNVFNLYNIEVAYNVSANSTAVQVPLAVYLCPSAPDSPRMSPAFTAKLDPGETEKWSAAAADYAASAGIRSNLWSKPSVMRGEVAPNTDGVLAGNNSQGDRRHVGEITDGTSNTVMLVESAGRPQVWRTGWKMAPDSGTTTANSSPLCGWAETNTFSFFGYDQGGVVNKGTCGVNCSNKYAVYAFHPSGANVVMADGSTRFLKETISIDVFAALLTRAGGEIIAADDY